MNDYNDAIALLKTHYPNAVHIDAVNQGNKFEVLIVDESFQNMRLVARQQAVYALFNPFLSRGDIHALSIHAKTPEEYQAAQ